MVRIKAEIQYLIFVAIFLFAAFVGVREAGFLQRNTNHGIDKKVIEHKYSKGINSRKIRLTFETENINKTSSEIKTLMNKEGVEEIYSRKQANNFLALYELPKSNDVIVNKLRSNSALKSESVERSDNSDYAINIKSNIENYQISKFEISKQLSSNAISASTKRTLREDLLKIQSKIDSLEYLPKLIKKSNENELVYITVLSLKSNGQINMRSIIKFIKVFLAILFVEIIALIMLYYLIVLMEKLLKMIGVKTPRTRSSNYNYNNYYGRSKKVKRVYRDQNGSDEDK